MSYSLFYTKIPKGDQCIKKTGQLYHERVTVKYYCENKINHIIKWCIHNINTVTIQTIQYNVINTVKIQTNVKVF